MAGEDRANQNLKKNNVVIARGHLNMIFSAITQVIFDRHARWSPLSEHTQLIWCVHKRFLGGINLEIFKKSKTNVFWKSPISSAQNFFFQPHQIYIAHIFIHNTPIRFKTRCKTREFFNMRLCIQLLGYKCLLSRLGRFWRLMVEVFRGRRGPQLIRCEVHWG